MKVTAADEVCSFSAACRIHVADGVHKWMCTCQLMAAISIDIHLLQWCRPIWNTDGSRASVMALCRPYHFSHWADSLQELSRCHWDCSKDPNCTTFMGLTYSPPISLDVICFVSDLKWQLSVCLTYVNCAEVHLRSWHVVVLQCLHTVYFLLNWRRWQCET